MFVLCIVKFRCLCPNKIYFWIIVEYHMSVGLAKYGGQRTCSRRHSVNILDVVFSQFKHMFGQKQVSCTAQIVDLHIPQHTRIIFYHRYHHPLSRHSKTRARWTAPELEVPRPLVSFFVSVLVSVVGDRETRQMLPSPD